MNRKKFTIAFIVAVFVFTLFLPVGVVAAANEEDKKIEVDLENNQLEVTIQIQKIIIERLQKQIDELTLQLEAQEQESIEIEQEPIMTNYSDEIQVQITEEQKNKISDKVEELDNEIKMLAKLIYREARGINSTDQKAAVVWCVLNRVDNGNYGSSISKVITAKHQFAWVPDTPVKDEFYDLAKDVVTRWLLEKEGFEEVGRVLPKDYLYFAGRDGKNWFRKEYRSGNYWNWSEESPY